MTTPAEERAWWDAAGATEAGAIDAIAADPAAWDGFYLEASLAQIVPHLDLSPGSTILDLGCGMGRLMLPLAARYRQVNFFGLDISLKLLRLAAYRTPGICTNVSWWHGDGRTLTPGMPTLDGAYSMITFQHIPREAQAGYLKEIGALLKPGGVFRFQVREGTEAVFLSHRVTEEWVKEACEQAGLNMTSYERAGAFLSPEEICPWVTAVRAA